MGIFGSLFGKNKDTIEVSPSPTHQKSLHEIYEDVFQEEMKKVEGISDSEKADILYIINGGDGGYMNEGGYHKRVYERYFQNREWVWSEFEKWDKVFKNIGRYPTHWVHRSNIDNVQAFSLLTAPQLKSLLDSKSLPYSSKDKKQDLVDTVSSHFDFKDIPDAVAKVNQQMDREAYSIYSLLIRCINFRTNNINRKQSAENSGIATIEPMILFEKDSEFIEMAWAENPKAIPPLFPGDGTMLQPKVSF